MLKMRVPGSGLTVVHGNSHIGMREDQALTIIIRVAYNITAPMTETRRNGMTLNARNGISFCAVKKFVQVRKH